MTEDNPFKKLREELAGTLVHPLSPRLKEQCFALDVVRELLTELAKAEERLPLSAVKKRHDPDAGDFIHMGDILEADGKRAIEIIRNCRIIARKEPKVEKKRRKRTVIPF